MLCVLSERKASPVSVCGFCHLHSLHLPFSHSQTFPCLVSSPHLQFTFSLMLVLLLPNWRFSAIKERRRGMISCCLTKHTHSSEFCFSVHRHRHYWHFEFRKDLSVHKDNFILFLSRRNFNGSSKQCCHRLRDKAFFGYIRYECVLFKRWDV